MSAPYDPDHITYFAETDFRNQKTRFGIKSRDRTRHMYVIGKSGVGKSTLLENMAIQDISNGEGVAILDPHGSFADKMLEYVPSERIKDVIYFAPFDTEYPISFNVLEDVGYDKRHFVASGLMSTFKKIWVDAWSARMEYILNNILLALLEYPDSTLLGVNRMLSDKDFRKKVVENVKDPGVKTFWVDEFAKYGDRYMQEAGAAIQNKIGQFTANPLIRNIIGQPHSSFDIRKAMDDQKILILNLSKGRIGEQNTALLGSMIITKIYLSAMSRAESRPHELAKLPNFYFYVDEFQSFANETFADILAEARKYKLALIIAHQYVAQMEEKVRDAVLGNVGTTISFRIGPLDAELLEKIFAPQFTANDLVNLGMAQIYLSLMINDIGSQPFSARTLPPVPNPSISFRNDCIEWSREQYAAGRSAVEQVIGDFYISKDPSSDEGSYEKTNASIKKPVLYPRKEQPSASLQKPFQKAFSEAIHSSRASDLVHVHEPRIHAKPVYPKGSEVQPKKSLFTRIKEQSSTKEQMKDEAPTPALSSLLASLNFEVKPVQKKTIHEESVYAKPSAPASAPVIPPVSAPIVDDTPFVQPRPPVKSEERAVKESSKALLRDALAKVQTEQRPNSSSKPSSIVPPSASGQPPRAVQEVSHEEIRKVLE